MRRHGYKRDRRYAAFVYSWFGYVQGFLNLFNATHNFLYYRRKRGLTWDKDARALRRLDRWNLIGALVAAVPAGGLAVLDQCWRSRGSVLTERYIPGASAPVFLDR